MVNDPAGAIGNMYSLHSPYFTAVCPSESYVVPPLIFKHLPIW